MTKRILLLGENALDVDVFGICERLSPEAPVPVQRYTKSQTNPGMAGNVEANLKSLWPGVPIDFVHQTKGLHKIRHVDEISGQQLLRVDHGDDATDETFEDRVLKLLEDDGERNYCACVISDYGKGLLTEAFIEKVALIMFDANVPVWLDTKKVLGKWSEQVDYVKINDKEYRHQLANGVSDPWTRCGALIVTRGRDGMSAYAKDGSVSNLIPAKSKGIISVCGAGDTTLAALVVGHFQYGGKLAESLEYAAKAAAVAVSKPGVVAVTWQEVEAFS